MIEVGSGVLMDPIPEVNTSIKLESMKHDQSLHRRWEDNKILFANKHIIIGANNQTRVDEGKGNVWRTKNPAIFYFDNRQWFNIIYLFKKSRPFYYCNLISPFSITDNKIQYIDYDIDFIVQTDYSYSIVDLDEYAINKKKYHYPEMVQNNLAIAEKELKKRIKQRRDPFNRRFLNYWREEMCKAMN